MDAFTKNLIQQERKHLTDKKPHTAHKIRYVKEYIKYWLFVACNYETKDINFIDCMSNAGIYSDGDYSTAIEVASEFMEFSKKYPSKHFNVLFNDNDENKIRIAKTLVGHKFPKLPKNMHIMFDTLDVNRYLEIVKQKYGKIFIYPSLTVLFVDPFDFRTVHIPHLQKFIEETYCEVFFNLITSDSTRNGIDDGIAKSLGEKIDYASKDELWSYIAKKLSVGKMKYCFSYPFKNSKNVELYQILFLTPHDAGLRKLKNAIWKTFHGDECYSSYFSNDNQPSLLPDEADIKMIAQNWAKEAMQLLKINFPNKVISFDEIDNFILTKSMLMNTQIIDFLLKPYIKKGFIKKMGKCSANTFRKDSYFIRE